MIQTNKFDKDYYENGIRKGLSGYENYHWMPTRSISEAVTIVKNINFSSALDFGCAKGFLVHALNLLGKNAIGADISEYAVVNCLPQVKGKLFHIKKDLASLHLMTDLIIAKDVLEHVPENDIPKLFSDFYGICQQALFIIPLGDNDQFRIREFEIDVTHVTKKDEEWWINQIRKSGFRLRNFSYTMGDVKEKWISTYPYSHGFFTLEK